MSRGLKTALLTGIVSIAAAFPTIAVAQDDDQDQDSEAIVVTGSMMVRPGGAQDIRHFREIASLENSEEFMPPQGSLTMEGLFGEHDLTLPRRENCAQMFCLVGHSMAANLPLRPQDAYFVGLDFDSNIDADKWKAAPLSLVAVVDRSGSMTGAPIAKVKEALRATLAQLGAGDRMGIVIYGTNSNVHLAPTDVEGHRQEILAAIDSIAIDGSTYLEAGLKLGYDTAFEELARSHGKTRLMLFTDENPNVGNTAPEGFMGQAKAGSERGVGLTTVGVGVIFDGSLAAKVASARGGNLFFIEQNRNAKELFDKEFRNMTSEVADDIEIAMTPPPGYAITGVFGVPADVMTQTQEGTVKVTVGTAFLSSNGGGIYLSLGRDSTRSALPVAPLAPNGSILNVELSYVNAITGEKGSDRLAVPQPEKNPPEKLGQAMALVDEYVSLTQAIDEYHVKGDKKASFATLDGLAGRLSSASYDGFGGEVELVGGLRDKMEHLAGYQGEVPDATRPLALQGRWKVTYFRGVSDLDRGDIVEIDDDSLVTYPDGDDQSGKEIWQSYQVNARQMYIPDGNLLLRYRRVGDRLILRSPDGEAEINMRLQ